MTLLSKRHFSKLLSGQQRLHWWRLWFWTAFFRLQSRIVRMRVEHRTLYRKFEIDWTSDGQSGCWLEWVNRCRKDFVGGITKNTFEALSLSFEVFLSFSSCRRDCVVRKLRHRLPFSGSRVLSYAPSAPVADQNAQLTLVTASNLLNSSASRRKTANSRCSGESETGICAGWLRGGGSYRVRLAELVIWFRHWGAQGTIYNVVSNDCRTESLLKWPPQKWKAFKKARWRLSSAEWIIEDDAGVGGQKRTT